MFYDITSLRRLYSYRLPATVVEADAYLQQVRETGHLLAIFQHYFSSQFPTAWTQDQDALLSRRETGSACVYSEAELRCLILIEDQLFPFAIDHLLMCAEDGERLSTIPLSPHGIDQWNRPISDFELGWQMLLLLGEPCEVVAMVELSPDIVEILAQAKREGRCSLRRMEELCQSEEEPLRYLPKAFRMINHSTENAFLDPTDEMPCEDMFWNGEDVALLKEHWAEAQTMMKHIDALTQWLADEPQQRLRKVVDVWNQSLTAN